MIRRSARALAALAIAFALAPAAPAAESLEELLLETKNARAREAEVHAEREKEFLANRDQQAGLVARAEARRSAEESRSETLSEAFDRNEKTLDELDAKLREKSGNLGELFGVVHQVAGDSAVAVQQSLISAEFPEREDFLRTLATSKELPPIGDLERLWFELQREMTESGRVVRAPLSIVQPDGESHDGEVVRIGPFIAMSGGRFLTYLPVQKKHAVLSRQPPAELLEAAGRLDDAEAGVVRAPVDPSRGVILALYVDRPNLWERIERGEAVGYVILAVGGIGSLCAIYQFLYLLWVRLAVGRQLRTLDEPATNNPLGRVLLAFRADPNTIEEDAEVAELRITEAVLREAPALERFQAFLRLAVAAGPLLGLVGTVIGMIITFQSITESGSSDPKLMADGIGQAMIATVLGLAIAIPLLFANAGLASLSRQVLQILDEQSAGILAESLERRRRIAA